MLTLDEGSNKKSGILKLIERFIYGRKTMTAYEIQDIIKASEDEGIVNEEESFENYSKILFYLCSYSFFDLMLRWNKDTNEGPGSQYSGTF